VLYSNISLKDFVLLGCLKALKSLKTNFGSVAVHACADVSGLGYYFSDVHSSKVACLYNIGWMIKR
jgi:hypothetical protein